MDPSITDDAVSCVEGLSVTDVRNAFAAVRKAHEASEAGESFWELFMPNVGLTMGEFCVGYLLRTPGTGR